MRDLVLDLDGSDEIWIDGSHVSFAGTRFQGLGFRFKIKTLTRSRVRELRREVSNCGQRGDHGDQDFYLSRIFMSQVVDWEVRDALGQIPFSEGAKERMAERFPGLTNYVAGACLDALATAEAGREEEVKNSSASGSGG